jgi:hypothetical protein
LQARAARSPFSLSAPPEPPAPQQSGYGYDRRGQTSFFISDFRFRISDYYPNAHQSEIRNPQSAIWC